MRNLFVMLAALSTLMLGGCLNSETHAESGLLFVRSSSLFEPSATVVLLNGEPIPFAAGGSGFEQLTGIAAPIGAAAVRRPNRTRVTATGGGADAAAGALGIGIGEGGDGGNGGGGGDGGSGGAGGNGHPHGGPPGLDPEGPPGHQND